MDITWLGHSCFRIRSGDLVIVTDPFPDSIGLRMGEPQAVAVTISHQHINHSNLHAVGGDPKVVRGPGEYELSGVYIAGVMSPSSDTDPEGKRNTAYLIEMENLRLCHPGDVSSALSVRQIEELAPVDILFLPAGGRCTLEVPQAIEVLRSLDPRIVIPMHYGLPGLKVQLGGLDNFLREMGLRDLQPQARLSITATTLPQEMRVVVLEPQGSIVQD